MKQSLYDAYRDEVAEALHLAGERAISNVMLARGCDREEAMRAIATAAIKLGYVVLH